jgi:hypothetical protein
MMIQNSFVSVWIDPKANEEQPRLSAPQKHCNDESNTYLSDCF